MIDCQGEPDAQHKGVRGRGQDTGDDGVPHGERQHGVNHKHNEEEKRHLWGKRERETERFMKETAREANRKTETTDRSFGLETRDTLTKLCVKAKTKVKVNPQTHQTSAASICNCRKTFVDVVI